MDLGIKGKTALISGASRGLGRGCANKLAEAGCELYLVARDPATLDLAAGDITNNTGAKVTPIAADITTEAGRATVLALCPTPDILVTNAGGPPTGIWSDWDRDDFIRALDSNALTPIALMQAVLPYMQAQNWGRIVNITSAAVKFPVPQLGLSNTARAALTGFVAGTSRQVAADNVIINNLLPGIHDTDRAKSLDAGVADKEGLDMAAARAKRMATIPAKRYGEIDDFGAFCALLCSQYAAFCVGQNIILDGGAGNMSI